VSGVSAVRDATIDEFGDVSLAMLSLNQSYYVQPPLVKVVAFNCGFGVRTSAAGSQFVDTYRYAECTRVPMRTAQNVSPQVIEHDWNQDGVLPDELRPAQPAQPANPATIP
jgi:hypothetical protein